MEDKFLYEPFPINRMQEYREKFPDYRGFKVMHLDLLDHPYLGNVQIEFVDEGEWPNGFYSSLIIGPNGSGKSYLLSALINIFRQLHSYEVKNDKNFITGGFNIIFSNGGDFYSFGNIKYVDVVENIAKRVRVTGKDNVMFKVNGKKAAITTKPIPTKILASSFMLWDKFPMLYNNDPFNKHYKYLGIRNTQRSAGTQNLISKTVSSIVNKINGRQLIPNLKRLLEYLDYDIQLSVSYVPKYRNLFWHQDLDYDKFCEKFDNWEESFSSRKTQPWGLEYYKKFKKNKQTIEGICSFINTVKFEKYGRGGRYIDFNVFEDSTISAIFPLIKHMRGMDILSPPSLTFYKNGKELSLNTSSSGETQIITSLIGILSTIEDNSLILIDEPEVSLHPNMQMKYMHILKEMFKNYPTCHFIVASHSHFMISDAEDEISKVIGVNRKSNTKGKRESSMVVIPTPQKTYGWSAEQVLLDVFNVATTRNYYLESKIAEILELMGDTDSSNEVIKEKIDHLKELNLDLQKEDPMREIVDALFSKT